MMTTRRIEMFHDSELKCYYVHYIENGKAVELRSYIDGARELNEDERAFLHMSEGTDAEA